MAERSATPALEVRDLNVYYGRSHALQGVDLTLDHGVLSVVGRNGMGKTTLCKAIMGLVPVASGDISFGGQSLLGKTPAEIARQQNLNEQTVYRELSQLIVGGQVGLEQALGLSEVEIGIIQDALLSQPNLAEDSFSYRQIKEYLADDWPTGVLHCVRQAILAAQ